MSRQEREEFEALARAEHAIGDDVRLPSVGETWRRYDDELAVFTVTYVSLHRVIVDCQHCHAADIHTLRTFVVYYRPVEVAR